MDTDSITLDEAARLLGVSRETARRRLKAGEIEGRQLNPRLWLVSRASVEAATAGRRRTGPRPKAAGCAATEGAHDAAAVNH